MTEIKKRMPIIYDDLDGGPPFLKDISSTFIETIRGPKEIQALTMDLIKSAKEEILGLFSTSNAFHRQERAGSVSAAEQVSKSRGIPLRFLTPFDDQIRQLEHMSKDKRGFEIRDIEEGSRTRVSILIVDRRISLVVELHDDTKESSLDAIGPATYCNSIATVLSYASFFESLWKQSELYEKVKNHDRLLNEFISMAAHELRTPIQPVLALSQHLISHETVLDPKQKEEYLEIIVRNAIRLQQLTEAILDITKIERRSLQLKLETINVNEIVLRSIQDAKGHLDNNKLKINYHFSENETNFVRADRQRLSQVMTNLLNNSIKYTPEGKIDVFIERSEEGANDQFVTIQVRDTGVGIDPQMKDKLFSKFGTKSVTGTGLGLFISKGIVEAHGGNIWAENCKNGTGACFAFKLPLSR
jgi:two-component system, OmpR family, sensor histidine kinase VicK